MTTSASLVLDAAQRGDLHHAVILHGPSAESLRELGLRVAQTLNCPNHSEGDDGCSSCSRITRGLHPDVHLIAVASERKMISVEQIRDLLSDAPLRPYEGRNKVFIVDGAESLSPGGSNALLKTLEEPARDTHFLLLTRAADLLLPTIRSRSQSIYVGTAVRTGHRAVEVALAGESEESVALLLTIEECLADYATAGDSGALLRLAAEIGQSDSPRDAIALLAAVLAEAAGGAGENRESRLNQVRAGIPVSALLAAADAALKATRWSVVNADPRLLAEQALASLVTTIPAAGV
jgi:hypothetical protein